MLTRCGVVVDPYCPDLSPPTNGGLTGHPCSRIVDASCGSFTCNSGELFATVSGYQT